MLKSLHELIGYRIEANDGELGSVDDLLFDDETWSVRYLVAQTGPWLVGRKTLIPQDALRTPEWADNAFPVALTREQIRGAPGIDWAAPVSRRREREYLEYFGWMPYWRPEATAPIVADESSGQHLRSVSEVCGYSAQCTNAPAGEVDDLIVEAATWTIRYLVVAIRRWPPTRSVLVAPAWVRDVRWDGRTVDLDLTREQVEQSPPYDSSLPVEREYEQALHDHYRRPSYWEERTRDG